jgi:Ca2+-binding EF-hand superfamily protein
MKIMSNQQINLTQLLDTFQLFDTNKDGSISFDEVCKILKSNLFD